MDLIDCVGKGVAKICGYEKPAPRSCSGGSCAYQPKNMGNNPGFKKEASPLTMESDRCS